MQHSILLFYLQKIDPHFCPVDTDAKMVPTESMHSIFYGLDWDYIRVTNSAFETKEDEGDDEASEPSTESQSCDTRSVLMATENSTNEATFTANAALLPVGSTESEYITEQSEVLDTFTQHQEATIDQLGFNCMEEFEPINITSRMQSDAPSNNGYMAEADGDVSHLSRNIITASPIFNANMPKSSGYASEEPMPELEQTGRIAEALEAIPSTQTTSFGSSTHPQSEIREGDMAQMPSDTNITAKSKFSIEDILCTEEFTSESQPSFQTNVRQAATEYTSESSLRYDSTGMGLVPTGSSHGGTVNDCYVLETLFTDSSTSPSLDSFIRSTSDTADKMLCTTENLNSYVANSDHHTPDQWSQCDTISEVLSIENPEQYNTSSLQSDPGYSTYPQIPVTESHPNSIQGYLIQSQQQSDAPTVSCSVADTEISAHPSSHTQSNAVVSYASQEGITGAYTTAAVSGNPSVEGIFCYDGDDEPLGMIQSTQMSGYIGGGISSTDTSHGLEGPEYSSTTQADSSYIDHSVGGSSPSPQEYWTEHAQPPSAEEVFNRNEVFASSVDGGYVTSNASQNNGFSDTAISLQLPDCVDFSTLNDEIHPPTASSSGYAVKKKECKGYEASISVQSTTETPAFTQSSHDYVITAASDASHHASSDACMSESSAGYFSPLSTPEYMDSPFLSSDELVSVDSKLAFGYLSSTETGNLCANVEEYPVHSDAMMPSVLQHSENQSPLIDDPFVPTENLYQTSHNENPAQLKKTGPDKHTKQTSAVIPSLLSKSKLTESPPLVKHFMSRTLSFDSDYCSGYSSSLPSTPMTPASELPKLQRAAISTSSHDLDTHSTSSLSQICTVTEFDSTSGYTNFSTSTPSSQTHASFNDSSSAVIPSLLCKRESTSLLPSIKELPSHIAVPSSDHTATGAGLSTASIPTILDSEAQNRTNSVVISTVLQKAIDSPTSPTMRDTPLHMIRSSFSSSGYTGSISSNQSIISSDDIFSLATADTFDHTSGYISSTASNHSQNSDDYANTGFEMITPSILLGKEPETVDSQEVGTSIPSQVGYITSSKGVTTTVLSPPQKLYHIDSSQHYTASPVAAVIPSLLGRHSSNKQTQSSDVNLYTETFQLTQTEPIPDHHIKMLENGYVA